MDDTNLSLSDLHDAIQEMEPQTPTTNNSEPPSTDIDTDLAAMAEAFEESVSISSHSAENSYLEHGNGSSSDMDRQDFPRIRAIEDDAFKKLLLETIDTEEKFSLKDVKVTRRCEGTFNHCAMLKLTDGREYAIKVPAQGTPELWTEIDAHVLRSEVGTMKYIRRYTAVPVMHIFGSDASCDNTLGAPYIIQEFSEGFRASFLFLCPGEDGQPNFDLDAGTPIQKQRREVFLRDLATKMAELHKFSFDKSGMLYFEEDPELENAKPPNVGPWFEYLTYDPQECAPFSNTQAFLHKMAARYVAEEKVWLDNIPETDTLWPAERRALAHKRLAGLSLFSGCAFSSFPGSSSTNPETFVLAHPDLDLQNIYVDDTGAITGIIDWQGTRTMPRPVGYASVPLFLRSDWEAREDGAAGIVPLSALDGFRTMYATYMAEALNGGGDAKYTPRSAVCWFAFGAAMGSAVHNLENFFQRMVEEVGPDREDMEEDTFLVYLSEEDVPEESKEILKTEFRRMFGG
jgi:hypothetical protein